MTRRLALLAVLAIAPACDPDAIDLAVERLVADRSIDAVSAKTNMALVAERFSGEAAMADMTVAQARARAVELLQLRLEALNLIDCRTTVTADRDAGTLQSVSERCRIGLVGLDGELDARVEIETAPCDTGECPSAVVWTLDRFDLEIGPDLARRPHFSGPVTLRDPVDPNLPMSWTTGEDFTIENRLGVFDSISHASWTVDADDCVTMQLESRLQRLDRDQDDDGSDDEIGTLVLSVAGLQRCPAKCPSAGDVQLAFGRGAVLQWSYGERTVEVQGPRGLHLRKTLACAQ
ncbi:MAG: hypothetical protein U0168_20645 [Nannocystaceae bacterium]